MRSSEVEGGSARPQPLLNFLCCICTTISISLHILLLCSFLLVVFNFLLSFFVKPKLQSAAPWQINLSLWMQNARYRSLNYIYSGVILPDQKFCRIVHRWYFFKPLPDFLLRNISYHLRKAKKLQLYVSTRNFFDKHNCQITYLPTLHNFEEVLRLSASI